MLHNCIQMPYLTKFCICHLSIDLDLIFLIQWLLDIISRYFCDEYYHNLIWYMGSMQSLHVCQTRLTTCPWPHFMDQWSRLSFHIQVRNSDNIWKLDKKVIINEFIFYCFWRKKISNRSTICGYGMAGMRTKSCPADLENIFMVHWSMVWLYG